jgi:hypothetical protein
LGKEPIVMRGLLNAVRIALMLAVIALAIVGTLIVLDVFTNEVAKQVLTRLMKIIGIWTGASLIMLIIVLVGIKKD